MSHWVRRYEWALPMFLAAHAALQAPALSAPALWLLLTWVPGRILMLATGIGLAWSPLARVILAVALSLAVTPLLLNPLWHWTNDAHGLLVPIWLVLTLAALLVHFFRPPPPQPAETCRLFASRRHAIVAGAIAAFVVVVTIGPFWPRDAASGPVPSAIHDYIKHHAVMWSLEQRPLPLGNPFFAPGAREPAYYYHFFYLIPATVRAVAGGISINLAFAIQAAIVALTTAGLATMLARRFFGGGAAALLAFALMTVVGGFDVVPMLLLRQPAITLDAWADTLVRVHSLLTQMVWTPQNVQGATIVLLAALLFAEYGFTRIWLLLGPLLGSALIGSTVWIAAAAIPALVLLVLIQCVWRRSPTGDRGDVRGRIATLAAAILIAGATAAISLPTLRGYVETAQRHGKSLTTDWPHQSHALLGQFVPAGVLANLLDLPWLLLIEFGPLVVLPLLLPRTVWRRAWNDRGMRFLVLCALVALAGFVTFRSHFTYNDFGQKIIMAAMIGGAVLGAGACVGCVRAATANVESATTHPAARTHPTFWKTAVLIAATVLGCPVALWQSPLAAIRRFVRPDGPLGRISVALPGDDAAAIRFLRGALTPGVVIQADPGPERLTLQQLIDHQLGVLPLEQDTHVFLGPQPERQEAACNELANELVSGDSALRLHDQLTSLGVTHVLLGAIERRKWSHLERFDEESLFSPLFTSGATCVYELR